MSSLLRMRFCTIGGVRRANGGKKRRYHEVSYASHGDPTSVLQHRRFQNESDMHPPYHHESAVRVEMLCAPLNPADVNSIQGKYPSPHNAKDLPLVESTRQSRYSEGRVVAGSEGLGVITDVMGNDDPNLQVGNIVTMAQGGLGTFRSSLWIPASFVVPLERGQDLFNSLGGRACTLPQVGGTAIRLLRDFGSIMPGDIVLQNAGNSAVGFMVSQLAHALHDVSVVSIVRRGQKTDEQWQELVHHLTGNGKSAKVIAEEDILCDRDALKAFQSELQSMSTTGHLPRLGFNAVGGESASLIQKSLDVGGTMVTYGGMSMRPVTTSTPLLIFRDLRILGYWHSRWMVQNPVVEKRRMLDELVDAVLSGCVECPPIHEFSLSNIQEALSFDAIQSSSAVRRKAVMHCQE